MKIFRTGPVAIAVVLFLSSVAAFGQHERKKEEGKPAHAPRQNSSERHSAPSSEHASQPQSQPHAAPAPPPPSQSAPSQTGDRGSGRRFGNQSPAQSGQPSSGESASPARRNGGNVYQPNSNPGGAPRQPSTVSSPAANPSPRPSGEASSQSPRTGRQGSGTIYQPGNTAPGGGNRPYTGAAPGNNTRPNSVYQPNANSGGATGQSGGGQRFGSGAQVYRTGNGGAVYRGPGGAVREVHTPGGAIIHHAPDGVRRVEVVRPGGRVVVANVHGNAGYVQRPLVYNNRSYVQRTYVMHNVSYTRVYRPYLYRGITFHVYTPVRYYSPGFYAWTYNPWARPVYYSWGWSSRPWYGYYGGYFSPYPYYASPMFWLTDYLIARTLEDAYEERREAAAARAEYAAGGPVALTPEVKEQIAQEVRRQVEYERGENQQGSADGPPPILAQNGPKVFVVSSSLEVNDGSQGCALTEGDVLQLNGTPPSNALAADLVVLASKGRDCRKGAMVSVPLQDLQEMQNQMRATIDQGLSDLQSHQGQNGLPALPSSAAGSTEAPFAAQVRADSSAASELSQVAQEASRAEQDTLSQAASAEPIRISLGQSIREVETSLGKPREIFDLGAKKVYVYQSTKVTFIDGKVTDVQ